MKHLITKSMAHTKNGGFVLIPDVVSENQKEWDASGKTFSAIHCDDCGRITPTLINPSLGKKCRARIDGDAYGLHTSGTGETVVRIL